MKDVLKDSHGKIIGSIEKNGTRQKLYDVSGSYLGEYDGHYTKDASGRRIGSGNLLVMLLKK